MGGDATESAALSHNDVAHSPAAAAPKLNTKAIIRKVQCFMLPWLWLMVFSTYIDRSNLSFAAFQFKADIHLSNTVYGLGASIFFVGYCVSQIPSNQLLRIFGSSTWLTTLIISWGIVSGFGALISSPTGYIVQRLILGIVEAGTFPGMWVHITVFHSSQETGPALAMVATSTALSQVIGAPIAAGLMLMDGIHGLRGWKWLFMLEGVATVLFGIVFYFLLPKTPEKAYFLKQEERNWLANRQRREQEIRAGHNSKTGGTLQSFSNWRIYWLAIAWLVEETVRYGILFWVPLLLDGIISGHFNGQTTVAIKRSVRDQALYSAKLALISAILYVIAAIAMTYIAWSSKKFNERNWHIGIPLILSGIGFIATPYAVAHRGTVAGFALLCIGSFTFCTFGPAWGWPAEIFHGPARISGCAIFNSFGAAGGIIGPALIGALSDKYSYGAAMITLGAFNLLAALLFITFPGASKEDQAAALAAEREANADATAAPPPSNGKSATADAAAAPSGTARPTDAAMRPKAAV
ncbi:g9873 [Coccomyxa viridis]|uniref:G9873 protein n=1 Tax=Coccomyxa viridis TaxID=1274662 RepID=A0ABP1G3W2_9CHLO